LICEEEAVDLSIFDDGVGFDVKQSAMPNGHLGLLSMKERVRLAKGTLALTSTPGHGTRIQVKIPLAQGGHYA
jgi:signal transduction histidine kinase